MHDEMVCLVCSNFLEGRERRNVKKSRYFETAKLMDDAFLALLQEKPLEFVTVKDVCSRAGVSRSTFYLHYEGITDLLEESVFLVLDRLFSRFNEGANEDVQLGICRGDRNGMFLINPKYLRPYLEFVRENRLLFLALIDNASALKLDEVYADMERLVIVPILDRFGVAEKDRDYFVAFYIQGCMAVVEKWVRGGCNDSIERVMMIMECCCRKS